MGRHEWRLFQRSVPIVKDPDRTVLVVVTLLLLLLSTATPALPAATVDWPLFGGTCDGNAAPPCSP